jgi:hypothetical protein
MARLIPALDDRLQGLVVWGLTSHDELVLLARDDFESPWFVIIGYVPSAGYRIRCRNPEIEWSEPVAYIEQYASTLGTAASMTRIACEVSGGWPGS